MTAALHTLGGARLGGLDDAEELSARAAALAARSARSTGLPASVRSPGPAGSAGSVRSVPEAPMNPAAVGGRFHTNREAARLARAVGARALTVGRDTWFGEGQYRPATADGRALIAHELAHVQQDRPGAARTVRRDPLPVVPTGPDVGVGVEVRFDPEAPWTVLVSGHPDPADVALELYGIALAEGVRRVDLLPRRIALLMPAMADRYVVVPEMLREVHADRFHRLMQAALARDVDSVESTLLETRIDGDDEADLISVVRWWSQRKDLLDRTGRSYFDRFLAQLKADAWYRDYGLWESSRTSYLDTLYTEVEERAGDLTALIAQNSVEFGGYEPLRPTARGAAPDEDLVARSAELVLERLEGYTSEEESGTIADVLVGLPPREKAAVLKAIMRRYDEREYLVLGRFGEAWEGGMLYWLFEDLEEEDGLRLAESIKDAGLMEPEVVDALVAGRGWGGKYLPWTTYHGQEAAQFWADTYEESEGAAAAGAAIAGGFASLWTPETAGSTALTLVTAGTASTVAAMAPRLSQGLLVVGTGITSYQVTIAGQELATGTDAYTGEALDRSELVVRLLNVVSGLLLLGVGFVAPGGPPVARVGSPPPDAAGIRWRIVGSDPVTGEVIAVGQSVATGQTATIRLNPQTGRGSATNLGTGQVRAIREFELQAPAAGALGAGAAPTTGPAAATPGAL
ncbi:eCIS core domain-containing protein, partial [Actinotalea ferrariae]|uniref:eCIS core domain-containing protein n=1 Tax=Actinotalea ferrariae TaxID=1386098 RepID=UPI001C8C96E1